MDEELSATMIDVAFALNGAALPREHRRALTAALEAELPWLANLRHAWLHRINVSEGDGELALLSGRSRLMLRVPRARAGDVGAMAGAELTIGDHALRLGAPRVRELLPHGTLYSHLVAAGDASEVGFLDAMAGELAALAVPCRCICGRQQAAEAGTLRGFSLMLDGLSRNASLRVLESGLGAERRFGCGIFVPHKSAVAVGA
ncbi:MAG: type I-MYXAN CRISPR-associated protein Cas6/Cmx6 [Burkholderiales bacterium]